MTLGQGRCKSQGEGTLGPGPYVLVGPFAELAHGILAPLHAHVAVVHHQRIEAQVEIESTFCRRFVLSP